MGGGLLHSALKPKEGYMLMSRLDGPEDPVSLSSKCVVAGPGGFCSSRRPEAHYDDHYTWRLALSASIELGRWRSAPLHAQYDVRGAWVPGCRQLLQQFQPVCQCCERCDSTTGTC